MNPTPNPIRSRFYQLIEPYSIPGKEPTDGFDRKQAIFLITSNYTVKSIRRIINLFANFHKPFLNISNLHKPLKGI